MQNSHSTNLDGGGQLGAEPGSERSLVSDDAPAGLDDRVEDGLPVPGEDGDEVDHLAADPETLLRDLRDLAEHVDLGAPPDEGHVRTWKRERFHIFGFFFNKKNPLSYVTAAILRVKELGFSGLERRALEPQILKSET